MGIIASTACVIHCVLTPVLISFLAVYAHFLPSEEHTHRVLAVGVTLLGTIAIGFGYRKHQRISVLVLMFIGLTTIFVGAYAGDYLPAHWCEVLITLVGSSCMILAHRRNHTFCRQCNLCVEDIAGKNQVSPESLIASRRT